MFPLDLHWNYLNIEFFEKNQSFNRLPLQLIHGLIDSVTNQPSVICDVFHKGSQFFLLLNQPNFLKQIPCLGNSLVETSLLTIRQIDDLNNDPLEPLIEGVVIINILLKISVTSHDYSLDIWQVVCDENLLHFLSNSFGINKSLFISDVGKSVRRLTSSAVLLW